MKRWIIAIMAVAGFTLGAPAQAEAFYSWVDVAQKPKLATLSDTFMRKQLCERTDIDGSCIDGASTDKDKALSPPPGVTDPPPELPPVSLEPLPPVIESGPLAPISAAPTTTAVPEPGSLSFVLLAALLLGGLLAGGARRRTQPPGSTYVKTTFVA